MEKLDRVRDAFFALNVQRRQQHDIFHVISSILHLGNIQFMDADQSNDPCRIKNKDTLDYVAFLLGVSSDDLETALVCRTKLIHRELCTIYLSADEAIVQRDNLAETLYSLLFSWILELINSRLCKDDCVTFIGILDFYGKEAQEEEDDVK